MSLSELVNIHLGDDPTFFSNLKRRHVSNNILNI
jgi:hypothetical protein